MKSSIKTLSACGVLLLSSACFVSVEPPAPTEPPAPVATQTATIVWFPPTATYTPRPTAEVSPTANYHPGVGDVILQDDFSDPAVWSTSTDKDASVTVSNGRINLSLKDDHSYLISTRTSPVFTDFYAEITANPNLCHGEDEYGFILRDLEGDHYRLALSCDGRVKVDRFLNGSLSRQAGWLQNGMIPDLAPSSSRLAVWAAGSELRFFVNDFYLFSVTDTLLFKGTIGVFVHTSGVEDVSVSFSDLKVWEVIR